MAKGLKGKKLVFIGAGNMAEALVKGIVEAGFCPADHVTVTDPLEARQRHFRETYGTRATPDNAAAAAKADVLVLAVKPQVMGEALEQIRGSLPDHALVISIAAGVKAGRIEAGLAPRPAGGPGDAQHPEPGGDGRGRRRGGGLGDGG